jgi:predicted DNA-binding transcriptional regulator YafY
MARGDQLMRQWNLLKHLQTRGEGYTLREMAGQFGTSERNMQRDLEALQELGFPIEYETGDHGKRYWRLQHDFFRAGPLTITLTEGLSLSLAQRLLEPLAGTHYARALDEILGKIRQVLPSKAIDYFASLDRIIYVRQTGLTDYRLHEGTIRLLEEAIRQERSVQITYAPLSSREPYATRFDPYGLVYHDGDLYVIGRSHVADAVRIFKVSRIKAAGPTNDGFAAPEGFDLEGQFRTSFGVFQADGGVTEVVVKFTGWAARVVEERTWHHTQRHAWLDPEKTLFDSDPAAPDALVAKFGLSSVVEFKQWVKGFGELAEVLRPEWLRAELREELLAAARVYE